MNTDASLRAKTPLVIDGVEMQAGLAPSSGEELASMLGGLRSDGEAALVAGGRSRQHLGNVPTRPCRVLDLSGLSGIESLEREDGVVLVRAGTTLATLRAACEEAGWELPLAVPDDRSTVGGAIATAALGARSLGLGPVRDAVLGLEVVLASGERTKCGGRVVKNVTGYDLAKLYTGSFGRLGIVTSAWLRLRAPAQEQRVMSAPLDAGADAFERSLAIARRETARAAVLQPGAASASGAAPRFFVEFAGDAASVASDARAFADEFGATDLSVSDAPPFDSLDLAMSKDAPARARISGSASQLSAVTDMLVDAGIQLALHPGTGVAVAWSDDAATLLAAADAARAVHGVGLFFEELPIEFKSERDVFALSAGELAITRALVARFDPDGLLNPGRFAGHL